MVCCVGGRNRASWYVSEQKNAEGKTEGTTKRRTCEIVLLSAKERDNTYF